MFKKTYNVKATLSFLDPPKSTYPYDLNYQLELYENKDNSSTVLTIHTSMNIVSEPNKLTPLTYEQPAWDNFISKFDTKSKAKLISEVETLWEKFNPPATFVGSHSKVIYLLSYQ
jgi:hypothetical protein